MHQYSLLFFYTRLKGVFYTFIFGASIIGGEKIIGFMNSIPVNILLLVNSLENDDFHLIYLRALLVIFDLNLPC